MSPIGNWSSPRPDRKTPGPGSAVRTRGPARRRARGGRARGGRGDRARPVLPGYEPGSCYGGSRAAAAASRGLGYRWHASVSPASCPGAALPDPRGPPGRRSRPVSSRSTNPVRRSEKPGVAKVSGRDEKGSGRALPPLKHRDDPSPMEHGPRRHRGLAPARGAVPARNALAGSASRQRPGRCVSACAGPDALASAAWARSGRKPTRATSAGPGPQDGDPDLRSSDAAPDERPRAAWAQSLCRRPGSRTPGRPAPSQPGARAVAAPCPGCGRRA